MYNTNQPLHLSLSNFIVYDIGIITISYCFGLFMHLSVEAPFIAFLKMIWATSSSKEDVNMNGIKTEKSINKDQNTDNEIEDCNLNSRDDNANTIKNEGTYTKSDNEMKL